MTRVANALADCVEGLLKGEAQVGTYIERYPECKDELLALLNVASSLPRLPEDVQPSPAWRQRTKAAILAKIEGKQAKGSASGA